MRRKKLIELSLTESKTLRNNVTWWHRKKYPSCGNYRVNCSLLTLGIYNVSYWVHRGRRYETLSDDWSEFRSRVRDYICCRSFFLFLFWMGCKLRQRSWSLPFLILFFYIASCCCVSSAFSASIPRCRTLGYRLVSFLWFCFSSDVTDRIGVSASPPAARSHSCSYILLRHVALDRRQSASGPPAHKRVPKTKNTPKLKILFLWSTFPTDTWYQTMNAPSV